ncbi:MAG: hypothetical protein LQ352_003842 [Teloschistes flavicans]|nr:MAG: hypothetical protein LQ352_003842 [Teloschistes flavicans]
MVHYIRFLKPPRLIANAKLPTRTSLTALITITTDLGDAFYPGDVDVHVALAEQDNVTSLGTVCWKSGMRCLRVEIQVALHTSTYPARFLFTCCESLRMDSLQLGQLPDIVSAWTEDFHADDDLKLDADLIIRSFRLPNGQVLKICEENGESIARHIWDAGIGLAAWLIDYLPDLHPLGSKALSVLELGTGCGIVGLVFGSIVPHSWAVLTDLDDDALRFAGINAQRCPRALDSTREWRPLDWKDPQSFTLDRTLDFIVASDCTYNSDSIPHLVHTINELEQRVTELGDGVPGPKVLISTKVRHPSESMFFTLLKDHGFEKEEYTSIAMPDKYRQSTGQDLETVDVYIFKRNTSATSRS